MQKSIKNMRAEDKLLFACTRQEFLVDHKKTVLDTCSNNKLNWDVVFSTAVLHGVAPLVYSNLKKCTNNKLRIPEKIMKKFHVFSLRNLLIKERMAEKITEAISFFHRKNINVMLIKGAALDILVYDNPWATNSGDIDLILNKTREEISNRVIVEDFSVIRNLRCFEPGFMEHHDIDWNGMLPINYRKIWDRVTKINYRGQVAFVMSPEDMLITACINSARKRFFRLKALCDIAEIIKKYQSINWKNVVSKSKEYHCQNIVYTALIITKMTLGCELPEEVLYNLEVNPVRAKIITYLSQRLSLLTLSSLYSGMNIFDNNINLFLTLTYATHSWYQSWLKLKNVYIRTLRKRKLRRWKKINP